MTRQIWRMMIAALNFPYFDPVAFYVFSWPVHWYALAYVAGLLFASWYLKGLVTFPKLWGAQRPTLTVQQVDDVFLWTILGVILGGRLGYVLLYRPQFYFENPAEILKTWDGGMSFHGGFLGVVLACYLFARKNQIQFDRLLDLAAAVSAVGLGLGRLANFVNAELVGRVTDVPWAVIFPGEAVARHPSQLYQAVLEGLMLFVVLRIATHRFRALQKPGLAAGIFAVGYGLARIFSEFFREPDAQLGYIGSFATMGMVLSVPMVLAGMWLILRSRRVT
jgi:phosphatidylglycerol---prolipoprotein diacylglyceryl transferase